VSSEAALDQLALRDGEKQDVAKKQEKQESIIKE
jgi:hypothetical protein